MQRLGTLMGEECRAKKAHVLLAPTINIPRSPLAGRIHECYGEDPYLAGTLAGWFIRGIESTGVTATVKHFVSPRALREIYLQPFALAIAIGNPGALMTAYNKINGTHVTDSVVLVRDVLRRDWKYSGLVMSDW
jgi:beta-glucosidase